MGSMSDHFGNQGTKSVYICKGGAWPYQLWDELQVSSCILTCLFWYHHNVQHCSKMVSQNIALCIFYLSLLLMHDIFLSKKNYWKPWVWRPERLTFYLRKLRKSIIISDKGILKNIMKRNFGISNIHMNVHQERLFVTKDIKC